MHGEAKLLLKFLDGSDNRYIIPVYQRNYDWKQKQCEQLYNDLIQIIKKVGISVRAVEKQFASLREKGKIKREGPPNGGKWNVISEIK